MRTRSSILISLHNIALGLYLGWMVFPWVPWLFTPNAEVWAQVSWGYRLSLVAMGVISFSVLAATFVRLLPVDFRAKLAVAFQSVGAATVSVWLIGIFYHLVTQYRSILGESSAVTISQVLFVVASFFIVLAMVEWLCVQGQWLRHDAGQSPGGTGEGNSVP